MSDLIARLQSPALRVRAPDTVELDDTAACADMAEAAAALAAKDAEIVKWRCIGASLAHDLADVLQVLGCCDSEAAIERVATLRARLAAAEVLAEKASVLCSPWLARHNPTKEMEETVAALAAYNAAKETSDAS